MTIKVAEDYTLEDYLASVKVDGLFPEAWGQTQEEHKANHTAFWQWRKRTFTEDLMCIRKGILDELPETMDIKTKRLITNKVDVALAEVFILIKGGSPFDDKYTLMSHRCQVNYKGDKPTYRHELRPVVIEESMYWDLVNN